MKFVTLAAVLTISSFGFSQQTKQAYFQYHINARAMDTSMQTKQVAVMYNNNKQKIYCFGDSLRVDHTMGGEMMKNTIVLDFKQGYGLMLTDGPFGKTAKHDYIANMNFQATTKDSNIVVVEFEETKKILGYECRKIMLKQNDLISTHWVTNEVDLKLLPEGFTNPNIPGFPMESIEIADGIEITRKLSDIKMEIENPEEVFSLDVPAGYQYQYQGYQPESQQPTAH